MQVNIGIAITSISACLVLLVLPSTQSVLLPPSINHPTGDLLGPECCQDSCCEVCDPDLPDVDTPFFGTGHQIPDTITAEGRRTSVQRFFSE